MSNKIDITKLSDTERTDFLTVLAAMRVNHVVEHTLILRPEVGADWNVMERLWHEFKTGRLEKKPR